MEITIRKAELSDLSNLAVLKQQVWTSTYATQGLREDFSDYVLLEYDIKNVKKTIINKDKLVLVALHKEYMVGCAEVELLPKKPIASVKPCLEISTLYILEQFQGFFAGRELLERCIDSIKKLNYDKVWLTVYHKNAKAIDFCSRCNFTRVGKTDFVLNDQKYQNFVMVKNI